MKIFKLVYKIKNPKTEKSFRWIVLKWHIFKYKSFIKSLPSCKYVNQLGRSYLKTWFKSVQISNIKYDSFAKLCLNDNPLQLRSKYILLQSIYVLMFRREVHLYKENNSYYTL